MQYAVSVTMLQAFNRYLCDEENKVTQQHVIDDILHKSEESLQMQWGSLFHAILEDPDKHRFDVDSGDRKVTYYGDVQMCITPETLEQCLRVIPALGIRESSNTKVYTMDNGDEIFVTMKADHVVGESIHEHKSRWNKALDEAGYEITSQRDKREQSIQAHFYADAFNCHTVRYNIFYLSNTQPLTLLEHIETITFDVFDRVHQLCRSHVAHFMEFAENNGLLNHLHGRMSRVDLQPF